MKLFQRFPNFHPLSKDEQHIIDPLDQSKYPVFTDDFKTLDTELMPMFREADNEAKRSQNWYRWMYIILVLGGALTSILIIIQIAFLTLQGFEIAGTIVASIVAIAVTASRSFKHHEHYLDARLEAERLRSEYFLFLAHINHYAKDQDRVQKLCARVVEIRSKSV